MLKCVLRGRRTSNGLLLEPREAAGRCGVGLCGVFRCVGLWYDVQWVVWKCLGRVAVVWRCGWGGVVARAVTGWVLRCGRRRCGAVPAEMLARRWWDGWRCWRAVGGRDGVAPSARGLLELVCCVRGGKEEGVRVLGRRAEGVR